MFVWWSFCVIALDLIFILELLRLDALESFPQNVWIFFIRKCWDVFRISETQTPLQTLSSQVPWLTLLDSLDSFDSTACPVLKIDSNKSTQMCWTARQNVPINKESPNHRTQTHSCTGSPHAYIIGLNNNCTQHNTPSVIKQNGQNCEILSLSSWFMSWVEFFLND